MTASLTLARARTGSAAPTAGYPLRRTVAFARKGASGTDAGTAGPECERVGGLGGSSHARTVRGSWRQSPPAPRPASVAMALPTLPRRQPGDSRMPPAAQAELDEPVKCPANRLVAPARRHERARTRPRDPVLAAVLRGAGSARARRDRAGFTRRADRVSPPPTPPSRTDRAASCGTSSSPASSAANTWALLQPVAIGAPEHPEGVAAPGPRCRAAARADAPAARAASATAAIAPRCGYRRGRRRRGPLAPRFRFRYAFQFGGVRTPGAGARLERFEDVVGVLGFRAGARRGEPGQR